LKPSLFMTDLLKNGIFGMGMTGPIGSVHTRAKKL
jgi:hypothetical protein